MNKWLSSSAVVGLLLVQVSVQLSYGQGSSILFYRGEDIYSINPDGTNLTLVTQGRDPVWSPDGSSILVKRGGNMWAVSSDGSVSVPLGEAFEYSWSRNGQQIVFNRYNGIYLINKDGAGERELVPIASSASTPNWSPTNDSLIVYYRSRVEHPLATDIFSLNVISGESRLVGSLMYILHILHPFSPDGTRLLVSDCVDGGPCVKVLHLATGQLVPIGFSDAQNLSWSPDGSRIMFHIPDDTGGLYLASSDGQVITKFISAQTGAIPTGASWSPGGDMIAFSMSGTNTIYIINADGSGMRKLTDGSGPVLWSPIRSGVQGNNTNIQMLPWGLLKSQWGRVMRRAAFSGLARLVNPSSFQSWK